MNDLSTSPQQAMPVAQAVTLDYAGPSMERGSPPPYPGNPYKTIWTEPRATMRWILYFQPTKHVLAILLAGAILTALTLPFDTSDGEVVAKADLPAAFGLSVLVMPIVALAFFYGLAWLTRVSGRWLGGRGTFQQVLAAIAWPVVISVTSAIIALPLMIGAWWITATHMESNATTPLPRAVAALTGFVGLVEFVLGVWFTVAACKTVSEAHGFKSAWLGFANLLISGAIAFVVLIAVAAAGTVAFFSITGL